MMKRVRWAVTLFVIASLVIGIKWYVGQQEEKLKYASLFLSKEYESYPATDFSLLDINGQEVTLSELKGKPVVLNFWASWCPPCREETPTFVKLYEKYKEDVIFLGVNLTNTEQSVENVRKFIKDFSVSYQILLDEQGEVAKTYQITGIPETFFINRDGMVIYKYSGAIGQEELEILIKKML
ncbi:TlpA family protein disulfide reductase [Microaerobacter geothermalis]|uniref:TlpA family protein disulfide reductase n=1 Tax=Microaerobacter geothermalis TaxID=674972 RepID=UPI001F44BD2B|nr:TlpA disulfide reductase family protein [Microaerobacter geothermalis]MCF6095169.1 TlpA family protein disulfide reductase [Microaerobacter geothermalis]